MLFMAICRDKPGHLHVRVATRDVHVAWLKAHADKVRIAGPFLDPAGHEMRGSLVVIEAEDLASAEAWFAQDPYKAAGLFESVEVMPWRWTIGAPA